MLPNLTLAVALALALPVPDVIPRGVKLLKLEIAFERGAGVPLLCRAHRLAKGETLADIALARLGSRDRVDEIVALNPDLDADELRPGDSIWLPPRPATRVAEDEAESVDFVRAYADVGWARQGLAPFPLGIDDVSGAVTRRGKLTLFLVPAAAFADFEAARKARRQPDGPPPIEALRDAGRIQIVEAPIANAYVPEDDAASRRIDRFRLDRDAETGALALVPVSSQRLDAEGRALEEEAEEADRRKQAIGLILLSTGGCTGLWVRRRRRAPCDLAPHSATVGTH